MKPISPYMTLKNTTFSKRFFTKTSKVTQQFLLFWHELVIILLQQKFWKNLKVGRFWVQTSLSRW